MASDYVQLQLRKEAIAHRLQTLHNCKARFAGRDSLHNLNNPLDRSWVQQRLAELRADKENFHPQPASVQCPETGQQAYIDRDYLQRQALLLERENLSSQLQAYNDVLGFGVKSDTENSSDILPIIVAPDGSLRASTAPSHSVGTTAGVVYDSLVHARDEDRAHRREREQRQRYVNICRSHIHTQLTHT